MTATRLKVRYRESILGWLWAVLQPLGLMALYVGVFSRVIAYDTGLIPYPLFVAAGLVPWSFCSTALSTAAGGMLSHQVLMSKVYFPREIVPLTYVAAALFDLLIAFVVLLGMMLVYSVPVTPAVLYVLPVVMLLTLHTAAFCLMLSALQICIRDVSLLLPFLLQIVMFTAPVLYPVSAVPTAYRTLYWSNPLAILVDAFREAVLQGSALGIGEMLYCLLTGGIVFLVAYWTFRRFGAKLVDEM